MFAAITTIAAIDEVVIPMTDATNHGVVAGYHEITQHNVTAFVTSYRQHRLAGDGAAEVVHCVTQGCRHDCN